MCGLYICCTNHHHVLSASILFPFSPTTPNSLYYICLCLPLCTLFAFLSLSFHSFSSLFFTPPPPHLSPPSLHKGLSRASLIGSVCWWRQSDLELTTDEVRSACCRSSTAACMIYAAQATSHAFPFTSQHTYTHTNAWTNGGTDLIQSMQRPRQTTPLRSLGSLNAKKDGMLVLQYVRTR